MESKLNEQEQQGSASGQMYERELVAFLRVLHGERPPDRTPEHELLVQETLLRATGRIPG